MIFDISERRKESMNEQDGSKEWARLPLRCLKDSDLTLSDVIVLAVIVDYIDGESKPMSIDKIIQKTSLSKMQVCRSIKALVKAEYLIAENRAGKKTVFTQCNVLPPKRQSQKKPGKGGKQMSREEKLQLEQYELLANFDLLDPEEQERRLKRDKEIDKELEEWHKNQVKKYWG